MSAYQAITPLKKGNKEDWSYSLWLCFQASPPGAGVSSIYEKIGHKEKEKKKEGPDDQDYPRKRLGDEESTISLPGIPDSLELVVKEADETKQNLINIFVCSIDDPFCFDDFDWPVAISVQGDPTSRLTVILINKCDLPTESQTLARKKIMEKAREYRAHVFFTCTQGEPNFPGAKPILETLAEIVSIKANIIDQSTRSMMNQKNSGTWDSIATRSLRIIVEPQQGYLGRLREYEPFMTLMAKHGEPEETKDQSLVAQSIMVDGQNYNCVFKALEKGAYKAEGDAAIVFTDLRPASLKKIRSRLLTLYIEVGRRSIIFVLKDGDFPTPHLKEDQEGLGNRTPMEYLEAMAHNYKADVIEVTKEDLATRLPETIRKFWRRTWSIARDMRDFYLQNAIVMAESGSGPVAKDSLRNLSWAFNNPEFSDIRLDVVESTGTKSIHAHKGLLFARSSTFRQILTKDPNISVYEVKDAAYGLFENAIKILYSGSFGFGEANLKSIRDAELTASVDGLAPAARARVLGDKGEGDVFLYGDECYDVLSRYKIDAVMTNVDRFQESEKIFLGISQSMRDIVMQLEHVADTVTSYLKSEDGDLIKALQIIRDRAGEIIAQCGLLFMLFQKSAATLVEAHAVCLCNVFLYRAEEASIYLCDGFTLLSSAYDKLRQQEDDDAPVHSARLATLLKETVSESFVAPLNSFFSRIADMANPELQPDKELRSSALSIMESEVAKMWFALTGAISDGKVEGGPVRRRMPDLIEEMSKIEKLRNTLNSKPTEEELEKEGKDYATLRLDRLVKTTNDLLHIGKPRILELIQVTFRKLDLPALEKSLALIPNEFLSLTLRGYLKFIVEYVPPVENSEISLDPSSRFDDQMVLLQAAPSEQIFHDVSFIFPDRDNACLRAHKALLSAHSDTFRRMFSSGFREREAKEIPIKEVSYNIFALMLKFIYANGNLNISDELRGRGLSLLRSEAPPISITNEDQLESALSLLEASHHYNIPALHAQAETLIMSFAKDVDVNDIFPIHNIAEACNAPRLQRLCRDLLLRYNDRLKLDQEHHRPLLDKLKKELPFFSADYFKLTLFIISDPALPAGRDQELLQKIFSSNYNDEVTFANPKKYLDKYNKYTKYMELSKDRAIQLDFVVVPWNTDPQAMTDAIVDECPSHSFGNPPVAFVLFYNVNLTEWLLGQKAWADEVMGRVEEYRVGDSYKCSISAYTNVLLVADATADPAGIAALQLKSLQKELAATGCVYSAYSLSQALDDGFLALMAAHVASSSCFEVDYKFGLTEERYRTWAGKRQNARAMKKFKASAPQKQASNFSPV